MTNRKKAFIVGIKSTKLNKKEISFLKKYNPWGIILFSRNINSIKQTKHLTDHIRKIFKDKNYPIIIDEEGGTVTRLKKIIDTSIFSQKYFGNLYRKDKKKFGIYFSVYINQISYILKLLGININTVPVLDVLRSFSSNVLKDRCYSSNPKIVSDLGNLCISTFEKNGIATVIKHIPGHGLSKQDSHFNTPQINKNKKELMRKDFKAFKNSKSLFAMTAHIIYSVYDSKNTATHSKLIIQKVIRSHIGFKGILISDDISMKSLKYDLEKNAILALKAGCNLVLHCNANLTEMVKLGKVIPKIDKFTHKKTSHFYKFLG